jgi:peptidyl-tRNA hydrolase
MSNTRMVIVVRRDLNMPSGLLAAQTLHTGMEFIRAKIAGGNFCFDNTEKEWVLEPYVSVLAVDTPEELEIVAAEAAAANLTIHRWEDTVPSNVLKGRFLKCLVGISIGPSDADRIKVIAGTLPLY